MELTIQGHNLKVTEALEAETRQRVEKLDRYLPNIAALRVDFTHEKTKRGQDIIGADEITIRHARGAILRAEERGAGEAALVLSDAVDKMYRQRLTRCTARSNASRANAAARVGIASL